MEIIERINGVINDFVWGPVMIAILLGTGILLTVRTKFLQVSKFPTCLKNTVGATIQDVKQGKKSKTGVSSFQAFSAAIAGTVGTGNIVGVSTALVAGGPGAIFWMWVSAFFGMMTKFSENVLGIYYRKQGDDGIMRGGPMYYIRYGLNWKWLAVLFSIFCVFASFGYNMTQVNSISSTLNTTIGLPLWVTGLIVVVFAALVLLGGIRRIGRVASYVVPFMALLFILMALTIIGINIQAVPQSFAMIFSNAFRWESVGGGIMGYTIMRAMRFGLARGIFSNEAGLGSSVMAHSASDVKEPVKQGMWGVFEVFVDTIVICTLMSLVLLSTGVYESSGLDGAPLALAAFSKDLGTFGKIAFSVILPLFAFTTVLSWSFYGEKATEYLFGKKAVIPYKLIILGVIFLGAVIKLELVWSISDTFNGLMAIPNLISLILMSGTVAKITKNYFERKKGKATEAMLSAYAEENERLKEEIRQEEAGEPAPTESATQA